MKTQKHSLTLNRAVAFFVAIAVLCTLGLPGSTGSAQAMEITRPIAANNIPEGQPGYLKLTKTASTTSIKDVWKMTLEVSGINPLTPPVESVLVIDTSGSMGSGAGSKMEAAKTGAKVFVDTLWKDSDPAEKKENYSIGVIEFSGSAATILKPIVPYTAGDKTGIQGTITGLSSGGGTPSAKALDTAGKELLVLSVDPTKPAAKKAIIFLTDGDPVGGEPTVGTATLTDPSRNWPTLNALQTIGGSSYGIFATQFIGEAIRNKGIEMWSIGAPGLSSDGMDLLKYLAYDYDMTKKDANGCPTPGTYEPSYYFDSSVLPAGMTLEQALSAQFAKIAESLVVDAKISALVYDTIAEEFELFQWPGTTAPGEVEYSYWAANDSSKVTKPGRINAIGPVHPILDYSGKKFTWKIDNFADYSDPDTLTYYVKLRSGCNIADSTYATNGYAYIDYTNANGLKAVKYFPNPFVTPDGTPEPTETVNEFASGNDFDVIGYKPTKASEGWKSQSGKTTTEKAQVVTKEMQQWATLTSNITKAESALSAAEAKLSAAQAKLQAAVTSKEKAAATQARDAAAKEKANAEQALQKAKDKKVAAEKKRQYEAKPTPTPTPTLAE